MFFTIVKGVANVGTFGISAIVHQCHVLGYVSLMFEDPEDDNKQTGNFERKFENGYIQKSSLITADSDEMMMGKDNHVLSISMENL